MKPTRTNQTDGELRERALRAHAVGHLETLTLAHHEGRLTVEAYRKLRAPLIDVLDEATGDAECVTIPDIQSRARASPRAAVPPRNAMRYHLRRLVMVAAGITVAVAACSPWHGP